MTAVALLLAFALILYHLIGILLSAPEMAKRPAFLGFQLVIHVTTLVLLGVTVARAW